MRFPTIHSNGTSSKTLRDEYMAAYTAVDAAITAVQAITCHGRDYYVQNGDAASEAYAEKHERLGALVQIKSDLTKILVNILEQDKETR